MKIVVLDGYVLNPGDLSWEGLESIGDLTVYDRTEYNDEKIIDAISDAEIIFTNKTPLNKNILEQTKLVKYIGVLATGYNVVDIKAASKLGITVTNIPAYSTPSVAQLTFALILEICHHVWKHSESVKEGDWIKSPDYSYWKFPLIELKDKSIGIIGFGGIGQEVGKIAQAFGMKVLASARNPKKEIETENCKYTDLNSLLSQSDFISIHCPLTSETENMINKSTIEKMKDGVILINTSRGPIINEYDLRDSLNSGKVGFAAVDVISHEPMKKDNPLMEAKNIIITPHIAWAPIESRKRLMNKSVENLKAFINGEPQNVIN